MKYKINNLAIGFALAIAGIISLFLVLGLNHIFYTMFISSLLLGFVVGHGLFLIHTTTRNKHTTLTEDRTGMPRRIIIATGDKGLSLTTEGLSPQEVIGFLEVAKHYVIKKSVGEGSPVDMVRRI